MKIRDERDELEKIIKNSPEEINDNVPAGKDTLEIEAEPLMDIDFLDLKKQCEREARTMIKNAISFMIPIDMIKENKYLKDKFNVDTLSLAGMIYQLRTNEAVQKALIDQINMGAAHPRMFEVFGNLSKVIGELNKQLLQTTEALKETYRNFKNDVKEQRTEALGPQTHSMGMITTGDGGVVTRGTKELINNVKRLKNIEQNTIKDVSLNYIDESQLILDLPFNQ